MDLSEAMRQLSFHCIAAVSLDLNWEAICGFLANTHVRKCPAGFRRLSPTCCNVFGAGDAVGVVQGAVVRNVDGENHGHGPRVTTGLLCVKDGTRVEVNVLDPFNVRNDAWSCWRRYLRRYARQVRRNGDGGGAQTGRQLRRCLPS